MDIALTGSPAHSLPARRRLTLFATGLALLTLLADLLFYSFTLEDSFITFRYAEHLAEGYGFGLTRGR